jgi:hypothetical protein
MCDERVCWECGRADDTHLPIDRAGDLQKRAREAKLVDKVGRDDKHEQRRKVKRIGDDGHELVESGLVKRRLNQQAGD